jgi:hypothetical protein
VCRLRRLAIVLLALGAVPAPAYAGGWSRPIVVTTLPFVSVSTSYFVQSPGRNRTSLVVAGDKTPLTVFDFTRGASSAPAFTVPTGDGFPAESLAESARGAFAIAWAAITPNPPPYDDGECWCRIRATTRSAGARFTQTRTMSTPRSDQDAPSVAIAPDGEATTVWGEWHPTTSKTAVRVAVARGGRAFGRPRTIASDVSDWTLDTVDGRPLVVFAPNHTQTLYAAAAPFNRARAIGPDLDYPLADELAGDGRGDEVLVTGSGNGDPNLSVAYRPAGGVFGAPHRFATVPPADDCQLASGFDGRMAVVAWSCIPRTFRDGFGQAALISPSGRILALSRRHAVRAGAPSVAIAAPATAYATWIDTGGARLQRVRVSELRLAR